jgi:hypothetical protein
MLKALKAFKSVKIIQKAMVEENTVWPIAQLTSNMHTIRYVERGFGVHLSEM